MMTKRVRALALLGVVATAACGDDPTGATTLTEVEAQQLASAVLATAFSVFGTAQAGAPLQANGPALVPYESSYSWEGTVNCPGGGSVTAEATVTSSGDYETGESLVEMAFTQVHTDCVVQSGAQPFTFDGSPSVVVEITYETDGQGSASFSGGIDGGLGYAYDGNTGTCTIDYNYTGTMDLEAGSSSYSLTGSVCGVSMSYQYNIG